MGGEGSITGGLPLDTSDVIGAIGELATVRSVTLRATSLSIVRRRTHGRLRAGLVAAALLAVVAGVWALRTIPFGSHAFGPDPPAASSADRYGGIPLDPTSPWPKFRANPLQNGRSPIAPQIDESRRPWTFRTGKGVFSSPVIDAEGSVYVGSADQHFHALDRDGRLRWKFATGEVIDSSALLDDRGRVYFGSGDGHAYALDRRTGALVWKFRADTVEAVERRYGVESYNVDWFEGNVAMLPDGALLVPNDNFLIYEIDRDTGAKKREYLGNELMWSLPAVNARTGRFFAGSQYMIWRNVFAFDFRTGERAWTAGGLGSNAASPLLTATAPNSAVVVGGFDGHVRAYAQESGKEIWSQGVRGHLYASPAQLSDGTIIQASTDGTVYALEPSTGRIRWAHDTLGPIRSSPAVDAKDRIYVGGGEGSLVAINPDGTLRWAYRLIDEERNDLNASPALGPDGIVVAGENGGVFLVPWDYPLTAAGRADPRTTLGPDEPLPRDGVFLLYTAPFGAFYRPPPRTIAANQPLTFTLFRREDGDTRYAAIDPERLSVRVGGAPAEHVHVSADGQFLTLVPREVWVGPEGGALDIEISGEIRIDPWRIGLEFFGGRSDGRFDERLRFEVAPRGGEGSPYVVPAQPGDPGTVFELRRFAAPNPTMLPSWNQIGFDSLHDLAGIVEGDARRALVWVIGGRLVAGRTVVDPASTLRFPLVMEYDRGLLTLHNYDGFKIQFVGSWDMPFGLYRASTRVDPATGRALESAALVAVASTNDLEYYGRFLQLMGMADLRTGHMAVFGGLDIDLHEQGTATLPAGVGAVRFVRDATSVTAKIEGSTLRKDDHVHSLLLVDAVSGAPVPLYYTGRTEVAADASGVVTAVTIRFDDGQAPASVRAIYLVDTQPAARGLVPPGPLPGAAVGSRSLGE